MSETLLQVEHLKKYYSLGKRWFGKSEQQVIKAVDDVSFS
ncbi:dipeptide/oligopeptide/nickel ABC transporter ATP-binding protein, partial [Clostridium perfringens]